MLARLMYDHGIAVRSHRSLDVKRLDDAYFEARPGKNVQLGISVGAAVFPQDGESYEALLATADSRMYQDKAQRKRPGGRDTIRPDAASTQFPDLTDLDIQKAAAGIL